MSDVETMVAVDPPVAAIGAATADSVRPSTASLWSALSTTERLALLWCSLVVMGALATLLPIVGDPAVSDFSALAASPSRAHIFGTDELGRDLFARSLYGARLSVSIALGAMVFATVVGGLLGVFAGYFGRLVDTILSSTFDVILAFPGLIVTMSLTAIFGRRLWVIMVALGIVGVPAFGRIARATAASIRDRDFVLAARSIGASRWRVIVTEIMPIAAVPVLGYAMIYVSLAIVIEGSLSYLGLSITNPSPSWGGMIAGGQGELEDSPHIVLVPAALTFFTVYALNILGERLQRLASSKESAL